jgi:cobalt/nickel transport system permease protein
MEIDRYAHLHSPVHNWDVRVKLISLLLFALTTAALKSFVPLFIAAGISWVLVLSARLQAFFILRYLRAPLTLVLVMFPVLVFTYGGETAVHFWRIPVYTGGLQASGMIALKVTAVLVISLTLFGTSKLQDTMKGMESCRVPSKLVALLLFTYRYIFLFDEERRTYFLSARLRGYDRMRGLRRIGAGVSILVTLLLRSYEQSEEVYTAMQLRGFTGAYRSLTRFRLKAADLAKGAAVTVSAAGVLLVDLCSLWR